LSAEPPASSPGTDGLRATERWFIRRGLPMFVEDYSAGRDVWTRALPVLVVLLVVSVFGTVFVARDGWSFAAALVATVACFVGYAVWNKRAGRRAFALPRHVTRPWLVVWVVLPSVLQLLAERDLEQFVAALVSGLVVLGLVYVITRYALVALTVWAVRWTFQQVGDVGRLITRVLPLLLLALTFLFISTEVWQVAGTMPATVLWATLGVFGALGVVFIVARAREEFDKIEMETSRDAVVAAAVGTPLEAVASTLPDLERRVPMSGRQRANLLLVMVTAQSVQVAIVGAVVWAFFLIFGSLAVSVAVQQSWLGTVGEVDVLWLWGDGRGLTRQLFRVATFLGGFAGFYATIYAAQDEVYRTHFAGRISATIERALAVRRAYLAQRRSQGLAVPEPDGPGSQPRL